MPKAQLSLSLGVQFSSQSETISPKLKDSTIQNQRIQAKLKPHLVTRTSTTRRMLSEQRVFFSQSIPSHTHHNFQILEAALLHSSSLLEEVALVMHSILYSLFLPSSYEYHIEFKNLQVVQARHRLSWHKY